MDTLDKTNTMKRATEDLSNGRTSDDEKQRADVPEARLKYALELDSMDKKPLPGSFSTTLFAAWNQRTKEVAIIQEKFSNNSNTTDNVGCLERFLDELPFMSPEIKEKLKEAATKLVATVSSSNVPLEEVRKTTSIEQKLLAAIPDKAVMDGVKRKLLESKRLERLFELEKLENARSKHLLELENARFKRLLELQNLLSSLSEKAHEIEDNVKNVDDSLQYVGGLSQEGRAVQTEEGTPRKASYAEKLAIEDNGGDMRNLVSDESLYADLLKGKKTLQLEELFPAWNEFTGTESYRNLESFCKDWNGFIQRSKIMIDARCKKKTQKKDASAVKRTEVLVNTRRNLIASPMSMQRTTKI